MKTTSSATTSLLLLLGTHRHLAAAARDRVGVVHDDITYMVDRYDDGRAKPYAVTFTDSFKSVYKFDDEGKVTDIFASDEVYKVVYRSSGELRKVKDMTRPDEERRLLDEEEKEEEEEEEKEIEEVEEEEQPSTPASGTSRRERRLADTSPHRSHSRRLYDCVDCEQTWDTLCDEGLESVCNLEEYGSPLRPTGEISIGLFCENFAAACSEMSASDVCDGECEERVCLPPLTITLEWTGGPENDASVGYALDLYVIEPEGTTVFWDHTESKNAGLHNVANKMTYTVYEGLNPPSSSPTTTTTMSGTGTESEGMEPYVSATTTTGSYIAFAEWWQGDAPIYWNMTATAGSGDVLANVEGQFTGDCTSSSTSGGTSVAGSAYGHGVSKLVYLRLSEYVDNGCGVVPGSTSYSP